LAPEETKFNAEENDHFLLIIRGRPGAWVAAASESAEVTDNAGLFRISVISESEKTSVPSAGEDVEFEIRLGGTASELLLASSLTGT
jgi:hypothetical protein